MWCTWSHHTLPHTHTYTYTLLTFFFTGSSESLTRGGTTGGSGLTSSACLASARSLFLLPMLVLWRWRRPYRPLAELALQLVNGARSHSQSQCWFIFYDDADDEKDRNGIDSTKCHNKRERERDIYIERERETYHH